MTADELRNLLEAVKAGSASVDDVAKRLAPTAVDLGFATLDFHRRDRCGFPEVILALGKTVDWVEGVVRRMADAGQDCFVTRVDDAQAERLAAKFPSGENDRLARTFWLPLPGARPAPIGDVLVVTAGTGDLPVAHEALNTVRVMGVAASLIADVGVAGIHRILKHRERLTAADAIIVCAGMDGALPSVVGGLVDCPVIAVPTSIGYGAAFGGLAALLTMLNSCSAGVAVVNIDAGFKAGYVAALTARRIAKNDSLARASG
ncbi:MAG: nickel pincer cofactor biosynthesis protein LarB [Gemmataceae bacterium]|nr:nickel pincer cofactor biosynthesis protein LarB [Planctomycetia bacterium]MBX3397441.1 nickel pincer cofactor biosynthesis protein LarB [Gemmataceae bacterium]